MLQRLGAGLLILGVGACTTFGSVAAPEQFITAARPKQVWVTRGDSSVVVVQAPRLRGDTLVGFVDGQYQEMMLSDARLVQARHRAPRRTVLAITAGVVGVALVAYFIAGPGESLLFGGDDDDLVGYPPPN